MRNLKENIEKRLQQNWSVKKIEEFYKVQLFETYSNVQKCRSGSVGHNTPNRYDILSRQGRIFYGSVAIPR